MSEMKTREAVSLGRASQLLASGAARKVSPRAAIAVVECAESGVR